MKAKLSALSLAVLPILAGATGNVQNSTPYTRRFNHCRVHKEGASQLEKRSARELSTSENFRFKLLTKLTTLIKNLMNGRIANFQLDGYVR